MAIDLDLNQYLGGTTFKGADFAEGAEAFVIEDVIELEFQDGTKKPALTLAGADKKAALGPRNLRTLMKAFGERTSLWIGQEVLLTAGDEFQGRPSLLILPQKRKAKPSVRTEDAAAEVDFTTTK